MKKYKLGMYLGRFQPFHNGHKSIVDQMLEECEKIVIVIGSAQEQRTVKNPFSVIERVEMIKGVYPQSNVETFCLPDRKEISNDFSWGEYVLQNLAEAGLVPDAIYQGFETERLSWWLTAGSDTPLITVSRLNIPVSATLVRAAILEKRADFIDENCPPAVAAYIKNHKLYGKGGF